MKLQAEVTEAGEKLGRLYHLVEDGQVDVDEILGTRIDQLRASRNRAVAALEHAKTEAAPHIAIEPAMVDEFGTLMRNNLRSGSIPFRKAHLRSIVDRVEIDGPTIRVMGARIGPNG